MNAQQSNRTDPSRARLSQPCRTVRHGTARHGTARHGAARHGTARHGTGRHGMARHGTGRQKSVSVNGELCQACAESRTTPISTCNLQFFLLRTTSTRTRDRRMTASWTKQETLLLIEEWGDERVQTELNTCKHNQEIYCIAR